MKVVICSLFRDAASYIDRYVNQVEGLDHWLACQGDKLQLALGYGDSADGTGELLYEALAYRVDAVLLDVSHGGPKFGPVVHPQRFKQLAAAGNKVWQVVPADADVVGWVESDLIWEPKTLVRLIKHLDDYPAVAPLVLDGPDSFYDIWAFRRHGKPFTKSRPFHPDLTDQLIQLDSAGSCVLVQSRFATRLAFPEADVFVGFCRELAAAGGSIWCDPRCVVYHPV